MRFTVVEYLVLGCAIALLSILGCKWAGVMDNEAPAASQSVWQPSWDQFVYQTIQDDLITSFEQAKDASLLCPKYSSLTQVQKITMWTKLIERISFYESSWNPKSRYAETTMGTDAITGQPVYSEGLMQMSYQDTQWATFCHFDWSADRNKQPNDSARTIFDPYKNLDCGMHVLANQIKRREAVFISGSGAYWAVIKEGNKNQKINQVISDVRELKFCQ